MRGVILHCLIFWGCVWNTYQNPVPDPDGGSPRDVEAAEEEPLCEPWRPEEIWRVMTIGGVFSHPAFGDFSRIFYMVDFDMNYLIDFDEFQLLWKDCTPLQMADVRYLFHKFARCSSEEQDVTTISASDVLTCWVQMFNAGTKERLTKPQFERAFTDEENGLLQGMPHKGCIGEMPSEVSDFCWDLV